jgi:glutamine synthetase
MARETRKITNRIYDAVDEGVLSWRQVAEGALSYMSEQDIAEMAHNEEFFLYEDALEDEADEDEDDPDDDDSRGTVGELNDFDTMRPDYFAMFSTDGNQRVQQILEDTIRIAAGLTDDEIWEYAYSRLEMLRREDGFGEAADTEVREHLWQALINGQHFQSWKSVNYWFYVNWYFEYENKDAPRDRFLETVQAREAK